MINMTYQDKPTIILVEDERVVRVGITRRMVYGNNSCKIESYHSVEAFLSDIEGKDISTIDLLLTDWNLGQELRGSDLIRILKEQDPLPTTHLPMMGMSGFNADEAKPEFIKAGAYGFMKKPFKEEDYTMLSIIAQTIKASKNAFLNFYEESLQLQIYDPKLELR